MRARLVLFFSFLFCVGVVGVTGQVVTKVGCTEYEVAYLYSDGVARAFIYNPLDGHVEITPFQIGGRKAVDISTGFNRITLLDDQGYVWVNDAGKGTATRWNTDATGAAFNNNVSIYGYFSTYLSIRSDGTIWYWGDDVYGFFGGSPVALPTKINQPAGVKFVKLATGNSILGLTSTGDVYEWDKTTTAYTKVNLPRPASDVAASHMAFNVVVVPDNIATSTMGYPYAWGSESPYWGGDGTSYPPSNPQALKTLWKMTAPIQKITANQNVIHFIDANNDLFGIGDNPNGEIGNGQELVNHADKYPTPYAWSWIKYEMLTGAPPIHVSPGIKFKNIFTGNSFAFYHYALDVKDSLYFWGRNKSFVGGDGVVNNMEATWPNALDIITPTMRSPLSVKPTQTAGYNFKMYTLKANAKQTISGAIASLTATATPSTLVSVGRANYGYTIVKYQWAKVSGPTSFTFATPNALNTSVSGLVAGTYVFSIQTTDNNTGTITAYDTVVVNTNGVVTPGPPGASAGADQTITLPTSGVTLTGTGLETNGTITAYQWTEVSGPNTAVFVNAKTAQTAITGLIKGTYVFQLTVTDKSGLTASDQLTVTVNAAPAATPAASAGGDQAIILPTNTVAVSGTGQETNGTIIGYQWTEVSGPNTAVFANAKTAATAISGLVQGTYVFQLTVTDKSGMTASDQLNVVVKAAAPPTTTFTISAGPDMTLALPDNSAKITGVATIKGETVASCKWTQVSGPNTAVMTGGGSISPTVSSLIQGAYVFQVTITSVSGKSASDQMTLTVTAIASGTFTASAGPDVTITLPTSSVKIAGVATVKGISVATCRWLQISGPSAAVITGGGSITPTVSQLVVGTYVFEVDLMSTTGVISKDQMKVSVLAAKPSSIKSTEEVSSLTMDSTDVVLSLNVYPNPVYVDQTITVEGQHAKNGVFKFMIYDISGRMVKQSVLDNQNNTFRQAIPLNGLVRGVYILTVSAQGDSKPKTFKILIQ